MPIPVCNRNLTSVQLPGDGTVQGLLLELGENIGDIAVEVVIEKLGITVCIFMQSILLYYAKRHGRTRRCF